MKSPSTASVDVDTIQKPMLTTHSSGVNRTYEWRVHQLRQLELMLERHLDVFQDAIAKDLGRDPTETIVVEIQPCQTEVKYMLKNLKQFMTPQVVNYPAALFPCVAKVENVPLPSPGVLIIGPSNYPLNLVLRPLAGVFAGGNPCVIKPSELTPNTSNALAQIVPQYFQPEALQIVLGGVPETAELLSKPWGKVLFTGSERVGRIVSKACAETLTPCVLELGGKCCAVIDESVPKSKLQNVADRLVFAKCLNAGQTCVAPDTFVVHINHVDDLCIAIRKSLIGQFGSTNPQRKNGDDDDDDDEFPRIVTKANTERLVDLIKEVETVPSKTTKVIVGGSKECDIEDRYVAPTVVLNPPMDSRMIKEEIFGVVFPIVTYSNRDEAISIIQRIGPGVPLFLYVFCTDDDIFRTYTNQCPSGGAVRNDSVIQLANHEQPFGGAGTSGHGEYFGKYSYQTFTNNYPVTYRPLGSVWDLGNVRCHPFKGLKGKLVQKYLLHLPSLPSITRSHFWMAAGGCLGCLVLTVVGPHLMYSETTRHARHSVASILENAAAILRQS